METITVSLTDEEIKSLDEMSEVDKRSRSSLVRKIIADYIKDQNP